MSSEEASVSVRHDQLSEEESWMKDRSSGRDGARKVTWVRIVGNVLMFALCWVLLPA